MTKIKQPITEKSGFEAGEKRPDLPTYRAKEVSKHDDKYSFWVTYRHGVYDVTRYRGLHPGGDQILNAAGKSIGPFWNVYSMHKTTGIYKLLETYRIGNLHEDDIVDHSDDELWVKEPCRDKRLIVVVAKPFNAATPPQHQIAQFDTPSELFYVRQHMPVPDLDAKNHQLRVENGTMIKQFSLEDLAKFPKAEIRVTLMCIGNRRSEMNKIKPVRSVCWGTGAISTAVWEGVYLRDVLLHCGVDPSDTQGKHVISTGSDTEPTGTSFNTSIPLQKALELNARVMLATRMNGAPLLPDHGYPLRVLVPGAPGVLSVKWLSNYTPTTTKYITLSESQSHWHQKDYRAFSPSQTWETVDSATALAVYNLPVTSAVCEPQHGDTVPSKDGFVQVKGYAYSGGGAKIERVDLTVDQGRTWTEAKLEAYDDNPPAQHYTWTLWSARLRPPPGLREFEIWVKAIDSNFNSQPENFENIWNIQGILSNAYHKIKIKIA